MRWATRVLIHFDRVASAWLIRRFVDSDARFIFLADGQVVDPDVTLFGLPGARLGSHNGKTTTFHSVLEAYSLKDPALVRLGQIVDEAVDHVLHDRDRSALASRAPHIGGILALAEGILLLSVTDDECLRLSMPFYDALYARLQAQLVIESVVPSPPASVLEQTVQLSKATGVLRSWNSRFSVETFAKALRRAERPEGCPT